MPQVISTVTGDGHVTSYVAIKELLDFEGPLLSPPTVTTNDSGYIVISDVKTEYYGDINGVHYQTGEVITFVTTALIEANRTNRVDVELETAQRKQTTRFLVKQRIASPGKITH